MKPFEQQTYYELLEIPDSAPDEEIRAAYARALETYSPDSVAVYMLADPGQVDALRARLTEAMEILTEPDLRAEYDRMIGVSRGDSSAVTTLAPALAAAAQAGQPQESAKAPAAPEPVTSPAPVAQAAAAPVDAVPTSESAPASKAPSAPAPVAAPPVETPAPAVAATPATPEPAPAPAPTPAEPAAASTPAEPAPVAPTPDVPAAPLVMPGVVSPNQIHAAFRSYAISYVPVLVPAPALTSSEAASPSTPAAVQADAPSPSPQTVAPTPAAPAPEPVAEPVPPTASALASPAGEAPRATSTPTAAPAASPRQRPVRSIPSPPPLPSGSRRVTARGPGPQPVVPPSDSGKGSARPGQTPGMDLEEAQQLAQESAIATAEAALAQVAAKAREPRPKPVELPPNAEFNGEVLRQVRESRGLSLSQLAERTRISSKHLENVEADRYSALPATVYLRGILMNIARELGLDPLKVSRSYLTLAAGPKKK
jgi:DNA-binding transcriptional regulator YiaG